MVIKNKKYKWTKRKQHFSMLNAYKSLPKLFAKRLENLKDQVILLSGIHWSETERENIMKYSKSHRF